MDRLRVIVQPGTGYELLLTALTVADRTARRRLDDAATWRQRIDAVDGGAIREGFARVGREPFINLLGFVHAMTEQPTAAAALAAIEGTPPRDVMLALVGYHRRAMRFVTPPQVMRAAVDGDEAARREFRRTSFPDLRHWQASLRYLLGRPADEIRDELLTHLARWHEDGFSRWEADLAASQERDAEHVRELVAGLELDAVLERIAPGIQFAREVGQSLAVLVPDMIVRPSFAITDHGPTLLIVYPAASDAGDPDLPPDRLIRIAKALGDPIRLRAMRELRAGPLSITELANRLGVPRTSLQHHVRLLTYGGLVVLSVDDARWGQLELRDEALGDLVRLAEHYVLGRDPHEARPVPTAGSPPARDRRRPTGG